MTPFPEDTAVLIVDDSRSMRRIVRQFLEHSGASRIMEAGNGRAALDIMERFGTDLVVSDLNMPGMNGLELLAAIREKEAAAGSPGVCFIMLTVEAIQKTMNLALERGANSYIVKPVTEQVFMDEVRAALDRHSGLTG